MGFSGDLDADAGNMDGDGDGDTPGLSAPGSSSSEISSDSFSDVTSSPPPQTEQATMVVSSPLPPPPSNSQTKSPKAKLKIGSSYQDSKGGSKQLTRRQRKALGLPKPRPPLSSSSAGAGKIIIPGGKWKGRQSQNQDTAVGVVDEDGGGDEEWRRNGTGRVDVRGFRELKI